MDYGMILGKSWKIFWKHKVLWLLGIIPYLVSALAMIPSYLNSYFIYQDDLPAVFHQGWLWYVLYAIVLVSMLGYGVLMVWGKAANSVGVLQAEKGQERLSLKELVKQGGRYFWKVLGLYSLFLGAMLVVYMVFFGFMFLAMIATFGAGMLCIFPFIILLIPVIGVGYLLAEISNAAIFIEELDVIAALTRGWEVLKKHFWRLVLMGLILYVGSYAISMIISLPLFAVMMGPMLYPMMTNDIEALFASMPSIMSSMTVGMMIVLPITTIFTGILYTYVRSVWMLTYLSLRKPAAEGAAVEPVNLGS